MRYLLLLVLFLNFSAVLCAQKRLKDTLILPFEYDKIEREKEHGYVLTKKSKKYLFNSKNFEIGQFKSEENKKGEIKVVDVVFDYKVVKDTSGYFTIDRNNTRLVPESFDDYSIQSNNQIIFRKGELYGLISVSGHLIITADVEELEYLGGLYYFKKNGVKGFLNVNGEVTFYGFDRYKVLGNGTYSVSKKTKYALVGPDGKIKTPYRYSKIGAFAYNGGSYPYINVAKTGKEYVFLDREGNTLSKPFYSMVPPRNYTLDKWIKVREVSGFCNFIKLNSERFFATDSTTYDDVQMLRNNRVCVRVKPKDERRFYFGIVNREGEFVVPPIYFYVGEFHNNIAPAIKLSETGGKSISGYLKEDGTFFEIPSNKLEEFSNGYGIFHDYGSPDSPGKSAVVDTNFNFIISPEQGYDLIIGPQDSMFILLKDSLYGYADLNGKEIIPCRYKQAEPFENGLAKVDNGRVYLNKKGEEVLNLEKGDELVDFSEDIGLRLKK